MLEGHRVSIWEDENVLKIARVHGCTTDTVVVINAIKRYTLKMSKMASFMLFLYFTRVLKEDMVV